MHSHTHRRLDLLSEHAGDPNRRSSLQDQEREWTSSRPGAVT